MAVGSEKWPRVDATDPPQQGLKQVRRSHGAIGTFQVDATDPPQQGLKHERMRGLRAGRDVDAADPPQQRLKTAHETTHPHTSKAIRASPTWRPLGKRTVIPPTPRPKN